MVAAKAKSQLVHTKVVIQGNADKSAIDELDSRLEKRNDDLVEKLRELWGLNDEGGLTV